MKRVGFLAVVAIVAAGVVAWRVYPAQTVVLSQRALALVGMQPSNASASPSPGGSARDRGVAVVVASATQADFPILRHAVGVVGSPAVANVSARVTSQVMQIHVQDGADVKAGDLLFSLDDRALKAQVDKDEAVLARDQAMLASAQADLGRAQDLAAKQAGTRQALDQATAAQRAAEATVASDTASLQADRVQLSYATITAPIDGRLGAVKVAVGDVVQSGNSSTPLVTITQMHPLEVVFNLPEADLSLLRDALANKSRDNVSIRIDGAAEPLATGTLSFVDSSVDTASGTVQAKATVSNDDLKLWPGQFVDVSFTAGSLHDSVSVPVVAVQAGQAGPFVYRLKDDKSVEVRPVKVALTEGGNAAIADGLATGDRVVTDGQARLTDGAAIRLGKDGGAAKGTDKPDASATAAVP
jgi:multidrug efflux system membrane fusion protein